MFRLPSLAASSRRPLSPWHRAALFGAGLLVLWLALQLAPSAPAAPPPDVRTAAAEERLPSRAPSTRPAASSDRLEAVPTRPQRSLFRFGNVVAVLILAGGAGWAVYLRRQQTGGVATDAEPALRALDALTLAPGQALRLVAVGDEVLLLGVAQGGITLLCRYDAAEAPCRLDAPAAPALAADFADLLRHAQIRATHHG